MKLRLILTFIFNILLISCANTNPKIPEVTPTATPTPQTETTEDLGQSLPITAKVQIAETIINLEVAETPQQQAIGLMYRQAVPDDRGMLFPFQPARPVSFWMKNVSIPLDMIFLHNGTVKAIAANVPPCQSEPCPTYGPATAVDQVIELGGGRAAELGVKIGDRLTVEFLTSP